MVIRYYLQVLIASLLIVSGIICFFAALTEWAAALFILGALTAIFFSLRVAVAVSRILNSKMLGITVTNRDPFLDVQNEIVRLRKIVGTAEKLIHAVGNEDPPEHELRKAGELSESIRTLNSRIQQIKQEESKRTWVAHGLAQLVEIKKSENGEQGYAGQIISFLVRYINANQGAFYALKEEEGEEYLYQLATYAYDKNRFVEKKIPVGNGVLGQCVLAKDILLLKQVPPDYVKITSGLGQATPRCIMLTPLLFRDRVYGVMEFASFEIFESHEIDFMKRAGENVAAEIFSLKNHQQTVALLESSERLAREMKKKEEEMKNNLMELTMTQEEMSRKQTELDGVLQSINRAMGSAEFDTKGNLLTMNTMLRQILASAGNVEDKLHLPTLLETNGNADFTTKILKGEFVRREFSVGVDGSNAIWLNATFNPVVNSLGIVTKVLMLAQDVSQRKLKEQELEMLSLVSDNTDNSVVITNAEKKIIYINKGFTRLTGYDLEEVVNKAPGSFLQGPQTDKKVVHKIGEQLRAGEAVYEEILNYRKDGSTYWTSLVINPIQKNGTIEKFISIQANITETKRKSLDFHYKWEAINRTNVILEFNTAGNIAAVNELFLQITGFSTEDLIGQSFTILLPDAERNKPQTQMMWQNLMLGQSFAGEFRCVDKSGKDQWLQGSYNPIYDLAGTLSKIMLMGQFITQEREKTNELYQYVNALRQTFPIFEVNEQLMLRGCNEQFLNILELRRMDVAKKRLEDILTTESYHQWGQIVKGDQNVYSTLLEFVNGKHHYYWSNINLVRDPSNRLVKAIVILQQSHHVTKK